MSDLISTDKQYRTRDGREVEVLRVDVEHDCFTVVVLVKAENGNQYPAARTSTGHVCSRGSSKGDLIEVKPRIKRDAWINVYGNHTKLHTSRKQADANSSKDRIACVKVPIDCEHGEGL